jgi:hypothetical protein
MKKQRSTLKELKNEALAALAVIITITVGAMLVELLR